MSFPGSPACQSGDACRSCRMKREFRLMLLGARLVESEFFPCPRGLALGVEPELPAGLGTRIARGLAKIPGIRKLPCYDENGKLKPESGCGKRQNWADKKFPAKAQTQGAEAGSQGTPSPKSE